MRTNIPPSRAMAEKTFGRKAHPDASLSPKEFIKKKLGMGSKPKQPSSDQIFRTSSGADNAGMYHSGVKGSLSPSSNPTINLLKKKK